jgi:hypothetical protein
VIANEEQVRIKSMNRAGIGFQGWKRWPNGYKGRGLLLIWIILRISWMDVWSDMELDIWSDRHTGNDERIQRI